MDIPVGLFLYNCQDPVRVWLRFLWPPEVKSFSKIEPEHLLHEFYFSKTRRFSDVVSLVCGFRGCHSNVETLKTRASFPQGSGQKINHSPWFAVMVAWTKIQYPFPQMATPWEFNIAPESRPSQKESSLPTIIFDGQCSKNRGVQILVILRMSLPWLKSFVKENTASQFPSFYNDSEELLDDPDLVAVTFIILKVPLFSTQILPCTWKIRLLFG